ncbi:MAG: response regulator transcription factor [Ignavibacteriales bacterium]|nr:response regulator transcription factor [Ignavibacteriales bacterium]
MVHQSNSLGGSFKNSFANQNEKNMIEVVVVEDNQKIREGLKILLNGTDGLRCAAVFSDCESMFERIEKVLPDVVLMDIGLPGMTGIEGTKKLKKLYPNILILVLTIHEENEHIFDALCAGACGYLLKQTSPSKLIEAIRETYEGGSPMSSNIARKVISYFQEKKIEQAVGKDYNLTSREKEVLKSLVDGLSCKAIADSLFISVETVRFHFRNIYIKLQVHTQAEAVAKVLKEGIV